MSNSDKTILVVDDDESVRSFLSFSLKSEGFNVVDAASAEAALKSLQKLVPNIILLDIMLPKMNGFTMCKALRANQRLKHVPVLFISADVTEKTPELAKEAGAQGLIEKPIMFDEFLLQILDALEGRFALPTRMKFSAPPPPDKQSDKAA